jgi:hypothetical protein
MFEGIINLLMSLFISKTDKKESKEEDMELEESEEEDMEINSLCINQGQNLSQRR